MDVLDEIKAISAQLGLGFGLSLAKYSKWFNPRKIVKPNFYARSDKSLTKFKYVPAPCRKMRYKKLSIPYLTQTTFARSATLKDTS